MRRIALIALTAGSLAALATALPAMSPGAQSVSVSTASWTAAAKAYERGRTSGTSPQTRGEYATCAAYWTAWAKALKARRLPAADLKPLPAAVKLPAAQKTADGWLAALKPKEVRDSDLAAEQARAGARLDAAIGGDAAAAAEVMEWLGLCPLPKG